MPEPAPVSGGPPPTPPTPPTGTMVDLNTRYLAACMEINTRIGQRQNTLVIYLTLVFGIGAVLAARKDDDLDMTPLLFAIPVASGGPSCSATHTCGKTRPSCGSSSRA